MAKLAFALASFGGAKAGSMGFEPTISPVTGERVNQATPRAHIYFSLKLKHWLGWESNPRPRLYECRALTN